MELLNSIWVPMKQNNVKGSKLASTRSTVGWVEVRNPTKKQSSPDEVKRNPEPLFSPYPSPFSFGTIRCAIAPYGAVPTMNIPGA